MAISREKAIVRVEHALAESRPERVSVAWDAAWTAIRKLESRNIGEDKALAERLADKMRKAAKAKPTTP